MKGFFLTVLALLLSIAFVRFVYGLQANESSYFVQVILNKDELFINKHHKLDWSYTAERFGHTQITRIGKTTADHENVARYCSKYITKGNIRISNHRYFCSKSLKKPTISREYSPALTVLVSDWLEDNMQEPYAHNRMCKAYSIPKRIMLFYICTGVRRCEALSIEWSDINEEENIIHIKGTKTEESDRHILLTSDIKFILNEQRKQNEREKEKRGRGRYHQAPESIVFPFSAQQTSREFKKLCGGHHLHELRHTFITRCCESGVNPSVCQQLVGHSTGDMIMNVYMHVMDEFKRREAAKFTLFPKF